MESSALLQAAFILVMMMIPAGASDGLSVDFYKATCPGVEAAVKRVVEEKFRTAPTSAAATLRLFFHDCFVQGCDASVIIASTKDNKAEKDADINRSLAGDAFDAVIKAKNAVEALCPGVVSCADVLAIAARDFVAATRGPTWAVKKGRRDGRISQAAEAAANLPGAAFGVSDLQKNFASHGLDLVDMVALSGAHTLGFSHCVEFTDRLYNFGNSGRADPSMNSSLVASLKLSCPQQGANPNLVEAFDSVTPFVFDNWYFKNLVGGMGLITSDQVLYQDHRTRGIVRLFSKKRARFFQAFAVAMDKMGSINVKTGAQGEIRRDCSRIN